MNLSPIRAGRWLALAPLLVPALAHPVPRQELLPPASPAVASAAVVARFQAELDRITTRLADAAPAASPQVLQLAARAMSCALRHPEGQR